MANIEMRFQVVAKREYCINADFPFDTRYDMELALAPYEESKFDYDNETFNVVIKGLTQEESNEFQVGQYLFAKLNHTSISASVDSVAPTPQKLSGNLYEGSSPTPFDEWISTQRSTAKYPTIHESPPTEPLIFKQNPEPIKERLDGIEAAYHQGVASAFLFRTTDDNPYRNSESDDSHKYHKAWHEGYVDWLNSRLKNVAKL